jgi:nitroreductase
MTQTSTIEIDTEAKSHVSDLILRRRSLRAFSSAPLTEEQIQALFEAARWAPSSVNEQPWQYIYANQGEALWDIIFATLNEGNRTWAKNAPLLVVSLARTTFSRNGRPNPSAMYDLGAANATLSLQATAMGLNVHQMGGFDHDGLRNALRVPADVQPGVVMAIGFPGDPDQLPESLKEREHQPRVRRPIGEFVTNQPY